MWASKKIRPQDYESYMKDARDYALIHGLVLRYDSMANDSCVAHIPMTLFPSPFPEPLYSKCLELQPVVNKLMLKIANDHDYINNVLGPIAEVDDFTRNLLSINDAIQREGPAQPIVSCISRADYMLDMCRDESSCNHELRVRQVEVNAIASGMAAHSYNIKSLQKFCMSKYGVPTPSLARFPQNDSLSLVAQGLIDAYDVYNRSNAQILVVIEPRSLNFSDHFLIELEISKLRPDIKLSRRKFMELPGQLKLGPNRELMLQENLEVAVVYFRYGYDPSNYDFEGAWETRLLLERSRAIKCPSINFHLSGAKKFQQVLNNTRSLERFLDTDEARRLSDVFCKFWSIESDQEEGYNLATSTQTDKLVLKPQREGGGHNIFASDIKPFVERLTNSKDRSQYILMEYIDSPKERNWLLLHDDVQDANRLSTCDELVSELGIYGSILAKSNSRIISNKGAGFLVRSKKFGVNEGGVASGYAGISSLILLSAKNPEISSYFI